MRPTVVHLDLSAELAVPNRCPACGSTTLTAVPIDERTGFRCDRCDTNWYVCFGVAQPVLDVSAPDGAVGTGSPAASRGAT